MSNEPNNNSIETSGDHSDASPGPNSTDMIALGKPAGNPEKIEPSSKDIVLQRLSAHSSWDNLNDAPKNDEPSIEPIAKPEMSAKRALPMAAIVAIAAIVGAVGGSAGTLGIGYLASSHTDVAEQGRTIESLIAKMNAEIASVKTATATQSQKIVERIDRVEKAQVEPAAKIAKLTETVEKLRTPEATGSIAVPTPATPNRLPVIEGWSLRDASDGMATLLGRDGIYDVRIGDPLPGVGRVDAIRRQDGRWVVVTSRGLIVSR